MLKEIDLNLLNTRIPNKLKFFNNLSEPDKNSYLKLYSLYSYLLLQYMDKLLDLKKYDTLLSKKLLPIPNKKMDIYQYLNNPYLNYIYIRNNIYIERLNKEKLQILANIYNSKDYILDEAKEKYIESTYKKVILETDKEKHYTIYGPDNKKYYKESNSFILGIRYDNIKESIKGNNEETKKEVDLIIKLMNQELKSKLNNIKINIINYSDFSTKMVIK